MSEPPARSPWPWPRVAAWGLTAVVVAAVAGPTYVRSFQPLAEAYTDFLQEWLSARNHLDGAPVYRQVRESVGAHMPDRRRPDGSSPAIAFTDPATGAVIGEMKYNAHPPAAVLIAVPFAALDYPRAHLAWNLVTFALFLTAVAAVVRELGIPFGWPAVFPAAILLLGNPVLNQIYQGQLNFLLAALVTAAWIADRRGRPGLAGVAVGLAGAAKLYPLFLAAYFLFTRRWTGLAAAAAVFLAANGAAALLFGTDAYRDYFGVVVPNIAGQFQTDWQNLSLTGFWLRLFETAPVRDWVGPESAAIAGQAFAKALSLVAVAVVARACWRATDRDSRDWAFALAVVGMLLVSPITWGHYSLLLLPVLAVVWARAATGRQVAVLLAVVAVLWLPPGFAAQVGAGESGARRIVSSSYLKGLTTAEHLAMISVPHYALLALFLLVLRARPADHAPPPAPVERAGGDS